LRPIVFAAALASLALLTSAGVVHAGPWCAVEQSGAGDGATNCGFVTWEQCMGTAVANRGYCTRNPAEPPRAWRGEPRPRKKAYRRAH